ncbi:MAG: YihY/virulence factor BrkB family protein [Candidatus Limivicinus sp.]
MFIKSRRFIRCFSRIYTGRRLSRASAALSYYLTMTFFPLVICLYTLLGNSYDKAMRVLGFAGNIMAAETVSFLEDFLYYVAANNSTTMMLASIIVLLTSASAAVRSLQETIGDLQGGRRFQGFLGFVFSLVFSLLFVAALYFAILVMLTGRSVIERLNQVLPFVDISQSWGYVRFLALAGIDYVIVWAMYEASKRSWDSYHTWPGALLSTAAMVVVSIVFSVFISASVKYPLIYGSLASVILLMLWLYTVCTVILCGAAFNIVIRDLRARDTY